MATAGRIPTTTVSASRTRDMAAIFPSIRPMNESTTSRAEMSTRTPWARDFTTRSVRSSCSAMASWSCMSTWMLTRRKSSSLRIGIRSILGLLAGALLLRPLLDRQTQPAERQRERIGQRCLRDHVAEVYSEVNNSGRDLGADAADDTIGPHQPPRGNGLEQM